ncbi:MULTISPECIES: hypothetical protein [Prauserella salsuginis group]|uniref:DUF4267 domain-containing protein n=2 Tax=Prauserella salsuginis group TaxID=2893672 RepID=A0A839XS57_9PSEU|nr:MULTISPECIES: hypothetical protein [Prauserella salsuginis group]MBB3662705.1 hypothetical protein [Prauserella sediminis]MCR3720405.1 hypothetical protein [Prauserella flava]MCR3733886.1 hypothetical protein [Prauserella salsuginis]
MSASTHIASKCVTPGQASWLDTAFRIAAVGRLAWGALSLVTPRANTRLAGVDESATPELTYLIRVFGSRALALGWGYLLSDGSARRRWRRLGLLVDVCDTADGLAHVVRGDVRRGAAIGLTTATGAYAALGVVGVLADLRAAESEGSVDDR